VNAEKAKRKFRLEGNERMSRPKGVRRFLCGAAGLAMAYSTTGMTKIVVLVSMAFVPMQSTWGKSVQTTVREANRLYAGADYSAAIDKYDEALIDQPTALEPKFNKANSYYRLDDLSKAIDLYREVSAESKDMKLVAMAKYNLGNTHFQQGIKQKDSDLQKAIDELKSSIDYWRQVLDIEPEKEKAAKNIEVARLMIKDIIDQLNKQQQQKQQKQQNQKQNQQQQSQGADQNQQKQNKQKDSKQDPNHPQDPNQSQQQQKQKARQQKVAPDTTADQILDDEQRRRKQRQILQRGGYQKVEKDW